MADKNLSQFTELTTAQDAGDWTFIWDTSANISKKISRANWLKGDITTEGTVTAASFVGDGSGLNAATTSVAGVMSATDKTKLNGIATGATANSSDATLLNRANHTGTQSADTVTDGTTNKVFTSTEKTKLAGIEAGAEVNVNADWTAASGDSQILNKPTLGNAAALDVGTTSGTVAAGDDARLSNARTPTAHATTHQSGGTDSIKLDDLATPDDNTDLNATTDRHGLLLKLGGGTTNFLRADGTWAAPTGGAHDAVTLNANLTDIFSLSSQELGADDAGSDKIVFWDDSEGKLTYLSAGSGLTISGTTISSTGGSGATNLSFTRNSTTVTVESDTGTDAVLPGATTTDAGVMVATDKTKLDGIAAGAEVNVNADWTSSSGDSQILNKPTLGGAALLNVGTTTGTVAAGDDARLSDARTPTAHASTHQSGGTDAIKLDDLATPDDNTDLNATTDRHGLLLKLGGGTTNFLRADGTWSEPPGGSGGSVANPTALVGLTAVNGTATSAIRSDGAPALDVSIAPTWTGIHTFGSGLARMTSPRITTSILDTNGNPWLEQVATASAILGLQVTNAASGGIVRVGSTPPTQAAAGIVGTPLTVAASNAVAGSSTAGSVAGGALTLNAGNAANLSSGSAAGGAVNINAGNGAGSSGQEAGGSIALTAGTSGTGVYTGGQITLTGGQLVNIRPGTVTITSGSTAQTANTATSLFISNSQNTSTLTTGNGTFGSMGGPWTVSTGPGGLNNNATGTAGAGGTHSLNTGAGGVASGNTAATGGEGGLFSVAAGAGGACTGTGGTLTAGNGGRLTFNSGNGGAAVSASGTRIGGNGGTITFTTGNGGNGTTINGNSGVLTLATGVAGAGAGTAGIIGDILLSPGGVTKLTLGNTIVAGTTIRLKGYTVATLPTSPVQGDTAFVTDATSPTYLATVVGGGSVVAPVFYNGTNWVTN